MSGNPEHSRLARAGRLSRQGSAAAAAGRLEEAVSLLKEAAQLDASDRRTLHRLGDLHRIRLNRFREAAGYYAAEARCDEREGFQARALALWRLVLRCNPAVLEAYERIGALYVELGRTADARLHYERSARELKDAGLVEDAAVLRAHLAVLETPAPPDPVAAAAPTVPTTPGSEIAAPAPDELAPDDNATDLAADRYRNARLFHHYGLHAQARQQLEELLASLPEHVEGRQLLVAVCRELGDDEAAAQHLRVVTRLLRRQGEAEVPATEEPWTLPPVEEWVEEGPEDPMASLMEEIREDVERLIDRLRREGGDR